MAKTVLTIVLTGAVAASLAAYIWKRYASMPESFSIEPNKTKCFDQENLCYTDLSDVIKLPNEKGVLEEYRGQSWAISWGNANGNEWPDLYINHHIRRNTLGRFPDSHLILDLGKHQNTSHFINLTGNDQHSALFYDFNGDGRDELLETIGGLNGKAKATDKDNFNILHYINGIPKGPDAKLLGVEQAGARGRQVAPFTINNTLWLAFLNEDRKDKKYGAVTLQQQKSGKFLPTTLTAEACTSTGNCASKAFSIQGYDALTYGLLSDDTVPDLAACQNNALKPILLLINKGIKAKGLLVSTQGKTGYRFCEQIYFPPLRTNVIVAETHNAIHLLTYERDAASLKKAHSLPRIRGKRSVDLAVADLNNDGLPDIITLQDPDPESETKAALAIYLSNAKDCRANHLSTCYKPKIIDLPNTPAPRNFALSDFNNDGTIDIFVGAGKTKPGPSLGGRYIFLSGKSKDNWLILDLKCPKGNNAIGALAKVSYGSTEITKLKTSGIRYETQDDSRIHVGLGSAGNLLAQVEVTWVNGQTTTLRDVPINRLITVKGENVCT